MDLSGLEGIGGCCGVAWMVCMLIFLLLFSRGILGGVGAA